MDFFWGGGLRLRREYTENPPGFLMDGGGQSVIQRISVLSRIINNSTVGVPRAFPPSYLAFIFSIFSSFFYLFSFFSLGVGPSAAAMASSIDQALTEMPPFVKVHGLMTPGIDYEIMGMNYRADLLGPSSRFGENMKKSETTWLCDGRTR